MSNFTDEEEDAADAALAFKQEQEHEQYLEEQEELNRARWKAQLDKDLKTLENDPGYHEFLKSLETGNG
jgi:hypothetical protein